MKKEMEFIAPALKGKVLVSGGRVFAQYGAFELSCPIGIDLSFSVDGEKLYKAIKSANDTIIFTKTPSGRLSIKHGKFRTHIACEDEKNYPVLPFQGEKVDFPQEMNLCEVLKTLQTFMSTDNSREWGKAILLYGRYAYVSNRIALVRYDLEVNINTFTLIPAETVKQLIRIKETPISVEYNNNLCTFHYTDGKRLTTALIASTPPNYDTYIDAARCDTVPVDSVFKEGVEALVPFLDERKLLIVKDGYVATANDDNVATIYEVPGVKGVQAYNGEVLHQLLNIVNEIQPSFSSKIYLKGNKLEAILAGMHL